MSARYLLDCSCGQRHPVETRQAGSTITCPCGATLEVPTLRGLKELPPAETQADQPAAQWTLRQGIVTAGVIVALILFGMGVWTWSQERSLKKYRASLEFNEELLQVRDSDVASDLEKWTPLQAWQYWEYSFKPQNQAGFTDQNAPYKAQADTAIRRKLIERLVWWAAAGIVLAVALAWAKFAPRS